jgi:PAS domain-containing protein
MPTGKPTTVRFAEHDPQPDSSLLASFFGFIECDIQPTRYLHHPLLCDYQDKKLLAHLYPMQRVVLTSVEFQVAVQEAGYRCTRVYRIDFYVPRSDLFRSFVREWLRLKIVSGAQPHAEDESAFEEYRQELERRLEIKVNKTDFKYNASLRTLAKLVLNSLWGKFGQRDQLVKCDVLTDSADMMKYHERKRNGLIEEKATREYGGFMHMKKYVNVYGISNKNVAIAAFVTAHARIRLWRQLHQLWDRVYYHDTDSIIYYYNPAARDAYHIPEGNFLGDWESETGEAVITDLVALAPKTYAYRYKNKEGKVQEIVKAKGFQVKGEECERLFTLDQYERLLRQQVPEIAVQQRTFRHVVYPEPCMQTLDAVKKMVFQYNKGMVDKKTFRTYPFGYEQFLGADQVEPMFNNETLFRRWQPNQRIAMQEMEQTCMMLDNEETSLETGMIEEAMEAAGGTSAYQEMMDYTLEQAAVCDLQQPLPGHTPPSPNEEERQNNQEIVQAVLYHAQRECSRDRSLSEVDVLMRFVDRRGDVE